MNHLCSIFFSLCTKAQEKIWTEASFVQTMCLLLVMQVTVEKFLTRATELETHVGLTEADALDLTLLKDNLLTFRNGIGSDSNGPKGFV